MIKNQGNGNHHTSIQRKHQRKTHECPYKFSTTDLEIVDEQFERIKKEAKEDYEYLESKDSVFYMQEELDKSITATIDKWKSA